MDLTDFIFSSLNNDDILDNFDCEDNEINQFLIEDSKNFQSEKIANTYLFKENYKIVAFFSISNDCLNDLGYKNSIWNKLHRKIKLPNEKRIRQYPAVKIARLGIDKTNKIITFKIKTASFPNWEGTTQKRSYTFLNNELKYVVTNTTQGGKSVTAEVVWKKL